jgi:hypothetical protein
MIFWDMTSYGHLSDYYRIRAICAFSLQYAQMTTIQELIVVKNFREI